MAGHVIIFKHKNLRGHHRHIFGEEPNLNHGEDSTLDDAVSSFVVLDGTWKFYRHANFGTPYDLDFRPGIYKWVRDHGIDNDDLSSCKCVQP